MHTDGPVSPSHRLLLIAATVIVGCVGCSERRRPPQTDVAASSPTGAKPPVLRDGFEGGSLAPFWLAGDYGSGRYAPGAVVLSEDYARSGRRSAQITVRQGDVAQLGDSGQPNERAELDSGKRPVVGQDVWCGYSFLLPPGFPIVGTRLVIAQWKQSGLEGSPIVAQRFRAGRHHVTIRDLNTRGGWREYHELPPIVPGRWHDMVYHVRFSADSNGVIEVWMDGERVVRFAGDTASLRGKPLFYHKLGLYRDRMAEPMTIYIDNYAIGESYEAVDPARFTERK